LPEMKTTQKLAVLIIGGCTTVTATTAICSFFTSK